MTEQTTHSSSPYVRGLMRRCGEYLRCRYPQENLHLQRGGSDEFFRWLSFRNLQRKLRFPRDGPATLHCEEEICDPVHRHRAPPAVGGAVMNMKCEEKERGWRTCTGINHRPDETNPS